MKSVSARTASARPSVAAGVASRPLWAPNVKAPEYLDGTLAGDYGWDPLGLGKDETARRWYRQAELVHARWAMLGCAGVLAQEIARPDTFWYTIGGHPEQLPGPFANVNLGGLLAIQFCLMHWVELRRWADYRKHGSVNGDPIFKNFSVPNPELGYPGGIFDPLGFSKGDFKSLQTKEIKNDRLAMVAFMGFVFAAQAQGLGPLAALGQHLSSPGAHNWIEGVRSCKIPSSIDVEGLKIPLTCLWPAKSA